MRYNFFTPSPVIRDLDYLQEMLVDKSRQDHLRDHYKKGERIANLIEEEKKYCLSLPEQEYSVFKKESVTANKYGEIQMDGHRIHIPEVDWRAYDSLQPAVPVPGQEGDLPY